MLKYSRKFISVMSLVLTLSIIISMAACGEKDDKPKTDKPGSTESQVTISGNNEDDTKNDDNLSDDVSSDKNDSNDKSFWDKVVDFFTPGNSKNDSTASDKNDSTSSGDNEDLDSEIYVAPIQAFGTPTSGKERKINIDTSKVVFDDYMSIGTNMFTHTLTDYWQQKYGFNNSYFELQKKQINTLNITTGRLIVSVETIVTNTEKNPTRNDWKNNADYKNYKAGIYDFDNADMQSMYKYLDVYKKVGTEINLNFGFSNGTRIQKWFASGSMQYPRDLDAFANAAAALLDHLINVKGYTNIKNLTFYNEPSGSTNGSVMGDRRVYYAHMINKCYDALQKKNLHKKVKILAAEHTTIDINNMISWYDILDKMCGSKFAYITHHSYYDPSANIDYEDYFNFYTSLYSATKRRVMSTEYLNAWTHATVKTEELWNYSDASQLICSANTGGLGLMNWEGIGGTESVIPYYGAGGFISYLPTDKTKAQSIGEFYNGCALINNYIGSHADVLMVDWSGEDIRTSAFRRSDGEYTVIVEANASTEERELTLNFGKSLGKKVYKYAYDYSKRDDSLIGYDSIIPLSEKTYNNVGKTLTDTLSKNYRVYIYTTAKPKKQVAFNRIWNTCSTNGSVKLSAQLLDCASNDKLEWSVESTTGKSKGTVDANGVYKPAADAKAGDLIAVKAKLKSDSNIYSIALISLT